jgi:adenylate cyclase
MRLTLRATVLSILLTLLLGSMAALGFSSYRNSRFTAEDLTTQVLEQTALRVDQQINHLLLAATTQGDWNRRLLESGLYPADDFARLAAYWQEVMREHHNLARLSFGVENTGEWYFVRRLAKGRLALGELRRDPLTGLLGLRDFWPGDYPDRPFLTRPARDANDPRQRPWYAAARKAGRQVWSETYALFGTEGDAVSPGVTCATPVRREDGSLWGVLDASFDLRSLCHYLRETPVGQDGYAFVVEFRADGDRRVIAHPDAELLLHVVGRHRKEAVRELVPTESLADGRARAFMDQLPPGTTPHGLEGTGRIRFVHDGVAYLGSYHCLSTRKTPDWLVCILLPESEVLARVQGCNRETFLIGVGVLVVAVLVSLYVARQVARPLEQLVCEASAVGRLEVEARAPVRSVVLEVDRLARAAEEMKTSLRSFRKYVPADLVRAILASGCEARPGGESRILTIFFCDAADFTGISEGMTPAALVAHLGEYLETFTREIVAAGGTVDKYVGDAIMAFWGAPAADPRHAAAACTAAVRCQQRLRKLRDRWRAEGKRPFYVRMGINTGEVVVGNIGSEARLNYTVIGDPVNVASRLEGLNKCYGSEILISEDTYRAAAPAVVARPLDWVSVKGRVGAVLVYELLGLRGEVDPEAEALAELHAKALDSYRRRDWVGALGLFGQVLGLRPDDEPARRMIARCRDFQERPPAADWDGVRHMECK